MKTLLTATFALLVFAACFQACTKDQVTEKYTFYTPVYQSRSEVMRNIGSRAAVPVQQPGKLAIKGPYVFLTELDKGIHLLDYSHPARPVNLAFIPLPGNADIAVRGNLLYADCYTSLVVIDISQPVQAKLVNQLKGVFPERNYGNNFQEDTSRVIVEWKRNDTVISRRFATSFAHRTDLVFNNPALFNSFNATGSGSSNGTGGSLARFALLEDRLYTVSNSSLSVFNTTVPEAPYYVGNTSVGFGIETIFPYRQSLFIGAQTGMYQYDAANPDQPVLTSQFLHVRSCDPVIAEDQYAFVTLRSSGSNCNGQTNELDVLDISRPGHPLLVKQVPLHQPAGLSKNGVWLFVCDGSEGLKLFNISNPLEPVLVKQVPVPGAYEVIAQDSRALVIGKNGLYLVDYTQPAAAFIRSQVSITQQ